MYITNTSYIRKSISKNNKIFMLLFNLKINKNNLCLTFLTNW